MKCPKCGYLGFERVERCRNCGYDFSLTSPATIPDLTLRSGDQDLTPLDDLSLVDTAAAPPPAMAMADASPDLDRVLADSKSSGRPGNERRAEFTLVEALTTSRSSRGRRLRGRRSPSDVRRRKCRVSGTSSRARRRWISPPTTRPRIQCRARSRRAGVPAPFGGRRRVRIIRKSARRMPP